MLSCAGLSTGVEPGEGEALNGEANESGNKDGKRKERKGREMERERTKGEVKRYKKRIHLLDLNNKYNDRSDL